MSFVEAVAQTLTEVAKDDLEPNKSYLMVDDTHAIVIWIRFDEQGLRALPAASYLCGFRVVSFNSFIVGYVDNSFVKFFRLPA